MWLSELTTKAPLIDSNPPCSSKHSVTTTTLLSSKTITATSLYPSLPLSSSSSPLPSRPAASVAVVQSSPLQSKLYQRDFESLFTSNIFLFPWCNFWQHIFSENFKIHLFKCYKAVKTGGKMFLIVEISNKTFIVWCVVNLCNILSLVSVFAIECW